MSDESEFEKELEKYIAELSVSVSEKEREKLKKYHREYSKGKKEYFIIKRKEWYEKNKMTRTK